MSDVQSQAPGGKRAKVARPRVGHAPMLAALALLCLGWVIYAPRVAESPDRPYVTVLLGASVQLLSGSIFVSIRRRWSPIFHVEFPTRKPWSTYGLIGAPLSIWLVVALLWWEMTDLHPHRSALLLCACAIPPIMQACFVLLADRSFRRHALQLLVAPALPPDLPSGARGVVIGTVEPDARRAPLHRMQRIKWEAVSGVLDGSGQTVNRFISLCSVSEGGAPSITVTTPGGPLLVEPAPTHWATDQITTVRPKGDFGTIEIHAEVRAGEPVIMVGQVNREAPSAEPRLTGESSAPVVLFGAPVGSNPRASLWWLYVRSWLRVLALLACAGCALYAARWNPMLDRYKGTVRVESALGVEGLKAGDTCGISINTYTAVRTYTTRVLRCQATLTCAGQAFYGVGNDGYFDCDIALLELGAPRIKGADLLLSWVDGNPAFTIDSAEGSVRYWDKLGSSRDISVEIRGRLEALDPL